MAPKKSSVKAGKPAPKTIEKKAKPEKEENIAVAPAKWVKVQTAEGWKRAMKKAHGKK